MRHDVARRVQFGTALVHSKYGITASQWICRALARDAGKANSYQLQHQAAPTCMFSQFATQPLAPYVVVRDLATACKTLQSETMGEEGFEHVQESLGDSEVFKTSGAECGANAAGWHIPVAQEDTDLKKLIAGWSAVPVEIRSGIILIASSCKSS